MKAKFVLKSMSDIEDERTVDSINDLENVNMIDIMSHQLNRFKSINSIMVSQKALWQKWIRL